MVYTWGDFIVGDVATCTDGKIIGNIFLRKINRVSKKNIS